MTAAEIAALTGGILAGPDRDVRGVGALDRAGPDALAFASGRVPEACAAGVLLARAAEPGRTVVVVDDPRRAFAVVLAALFPEVHADGVHPGAVVHPTARLGRGVVVYPGCHVGAGCEVGEGTVLFPNVVLYPGTVIGRRCRVHAGAVLGADGFAYHPTAAGPLKVPQLGRVRVGDDVEIGANSTIDRAALDETVIGDGTKIDNLVQIGHNCRLGRGVVIAGQAGLSGSVTVGDGAVLAGQVGVADHARVGAGAVVGAQSGVTGRVPDGAVVLGTPALPAAEARRVYAVWRRLPELWRAVWGDRRSTE